MLFLYVVLLASCLGLLVGGIVEQLRHQRNLIRIPNRVLVNGTRGKSSIARLCAGALRGGGHVVVAKTTGTAARFIFPDGTEEPVYRKFGIANVVEQIGIVRRAAAFRPDTLVMECMAVAPDLQEISQSKLIQSTIAVLSNVREDHLAEMGPTLDDVARSLSRSMPIGRICVTAERDRLQLLQREAAKRNCRLIVVDPESVSDEEMRGFGWITFKENVAIALVVADLLGVGRRAALEGMWSAPPDPGVLTVNYYFAHGKRIQLANVLAANDPASTLMNLERLRETGMVNHPMYLLINCRPDRPERNRQMGEIVARVNPSGVILIGEPTHSAGAHVAEPWQSTIVDLGGIGDARALLRRIADAVPDTAAIVAIGSVHGQGEVLLREVSGLPTWHPGGDDHAAAVPGIDHVPARERIH